MQPWTELALSTFYLIGSPAWETADHGVVSLLDMFEFAAQDFVDISYRFGILIEAASRPRPLVGDLEIKNLETKIGNCFGDLFSKGSRMGLKVTTDQMISFFKELHAQASAEVQEQNLKNLINGILLATGPMDTARMSHYAEMLQSTMKSELSSMLFFSVSKERNDYAKNWVTSDEILDKFPTSAVELNRGARCFAFGEPTACVFHAMRALESGLTALANVFSVPAEHENWHNIIEGIEAAVRELGKLPKGQAKVEEEKFFGGAVSHLYFVKNAWRNHVAHSRDSYSDGEARKILDRSKDFIESLCPRLQEKRS